MSAGHPAVQGKLTSKSMREVAGGGRTRYPRWMIRLPLSVHPISGETGTSLASRLAQANHVPLREFLRDMGIGIHSLIAGESAVLTQLAELSGAPVAALRQGTPWTSDGGHGLRVIAFPLPASAAKRCAVAPTAWKPSRGSVEYGRCRS